METDDDSDYGYWLVCDIEYGTDLATLLSTCNDKTEHLALMLYKWKIDEIE